MRFQEDKMSSLVCSDGVSRDIHIWQAENPKAVFVAIHGGLAHAGDYCTPGLYFKERGYATVSYDMHGHDRKEKVVIPEFDVFLKDLDLFLNWVRENYPGKPLFMMGHSMGALILTHFVLRWMNKPDPDIKGFIFSSPYYDNAVKVPAVLLSLSGVLSAVAPSMTVPAEDFTDQLTHDAAITARHHADAADKYRAKTISARFGRAMINAQNYLPGQMSRWNQPLLVFIAGNDKITNPVATQQYLDQIDDQWVTAYTYPDNYHENFNETNREEIFAIIDEWVKARL